jgi:uncharacterized protein YwgA
MNAAQFLLSLIDASDGNIQGRTLLQKRAFFVALLSGIDSGLAFDAYYYGPYSSTLDNTVAQLKNLDFIDEDDTPFGVISGGFEMRRYDYKLTSQGIEVVQKLRNTEEYSKIRQGVQKIEAAGNPNYFELSIAAKAFFILRKQRRPMSTEEIKREAEKFNWDIQPQSLEKAVTFLQRLGLTRGAENN